MADVQKPNDRLQELYEVLNKIKAWHGEEEGVMTSVAVFQNIAEGIITGCDYVAAMNCADSIYGMMQNPTETYVDISKTASVDDLFEEVKRDLYSLATEKALTGYVVAAGDLFGQTRSGSICMKILSQIVVNDALKEITASLNEFQKNEMKDEDERIAAAYLLGLYYTCCRRTMIVGDDAGDRMTMYVFKHQGDKNLLFWQGACVSLQILKDAWAEKKSPEILDAVFTYAQAVKTLSGKYDPKAVDEETGIAIASAIVYAKDSAALFQTTRAVRLYFEQNGHGN